ncbi:MAG: hypothetical protein BIFFINMI_00581 [Phycisphaerae bacterium]|nr:hypothetical protein [Phycisphaerae bacterium]
MIRTFLTAYDSSDLPGGSIDPLGFERGYLFLADKILPGLTNVASRPRYFGLLCAGIWLAELSDDLTPRQQYQKRLDSILRAERVWALANVLASGRDGDALSSSGVRGVTYANRYAAELAIRGATRATANYRLLSRQMQYGVIGIYANVADGMRLLERQSLSLTADLGERLGEAFIDETEMPSRVRQAIRADGPEIPLSVLADWGARAHVMGEAAAGEARSLSECLHMNPVRSRMAAVLRKNPYKGERDTELDRLGRIAKSLDRDSDNSDLREAVTAIIRYEACYRLAQLGLERILWMCRHHPAARLQDMRDDPILRLVASRLADAVVCLVDALDSAQTVAFRGDLDRLADVRQFLVEAQKVCERPDSLALTILRRHTDVQHGKFDRGRRKMPWVESRDGEIRLTTTRAGGLNYEADSPDNIVPHPYRLDSADALLRAGRLA